MVSDSRDIVAVADKNLPDTHGRGTKPVKELVVAHKQLSISKSSSSKPYVILSFPLLCYTASGLVRLNRYLQNCNDHCVDLHNRQWLGALRQAR